MFHSSFRKHLQKYLSILFILGTSFLFGNCIGFTKERLSSLETNGTALSSQNWGLGFGESGTPPSGNASPDELKTYDTYFLGNTNKKKIYLTFDSGFENGNTKKILETLKKNHVPATFFLVGTYIEQNPDLVKQIVKDGHFVGNHTYSHPNMSKISSFENFQTELSKVEDSYKNLIGKEMPKLYRPPQGIYSKENLQMAQKLGYKTFFWSLAYVDWYENQQPSKEEALSKLNSRIHPGAIVLLHSTSSTNAMILDELIKNWQNMGYEFSSLSDF